MRRADCRLDSAAVLSRSAPNNRMCGATRILLCVALTGRCGLCYLARVGTSRSAPPITTPLPLCCGRGRASGAGEGELYGRGGRRAQPPVAEGSGPPHHCPTVHSLCLSERSGYPLPPAEALSQPKGKNPGPDLPLSQKGEAPSTLVLERRVRDNIFRDSECPVPRDSARINSALRVAAWPNAPDC